MIRLDLSTNFTEDALRKLRSQELGRDVYKFELQNVFTRLNSFFNSIGLIDATSLEIHKAVQLCFGVEIPIHCTI